MATIKQEVEDAADECGIIAPSAWLASTERDAVQIRSFVRAISADILDRHEWTGASRELLIEPVVETASVTRPANWLRKHRDRDAVYEISPNRRPMIPVTNDGAMVSMKAYGFSGAQRYYRNTATGYEFYRPLPPGSVAKIQYVSTEWIIGGKSAWTDEANDTPIFPSRLIRFGLIARWRNQKGIGGADEKAEYETILARAISEDRPIGRIATDGRSAMSVHPMRVPVPDFIPGA
ncbi:MAG: hypothetical protein ACRC6I_18115 [Paracoccaceae bacterium]